MDRNENKKADYVLIDMELGYNSKNVILMHEEQIINSDNISQIQLINNEELS